MRDDAMSLARVMVAVAVLGGCTDVKESLPARTATEQLLISAAADDAAEHLKLDVPEGRKAYVEASNVDGVDAKYAVSAVKDALLKQGVRLTNDRDKADVFVEVRLGALSMDQSNTILGVPAISLPGTVTLPEASVYSAKENMAVAKIAAFAYDAKTGEYIASAEPIYGRADEKSYRAMSLFSWKTAPPYPVE